MGRNNTAAVISALLLVVIVVSMDVLFFRDRSWLRLMANVGVVLLFGAFYLRFVKHS